MSSSNNESMRLPWDIILRELYAKGEVPEDVLNDADAFMQWWKSLEPARQDEIRSRIRDISAHRNTAEGETEEQGHQKENDTFVRSSREQALSALKTLAGGGGGVSLTDDDLDVLERDPKEAGEHSEHLAGIYNAISYGFFHCAAEGSELIPESRVTAKFGHSIKDNYPEANEVFLRFAKTYWTLQVLTYDLMRNDTEWIGAHLLGKLEQFIGPVFFPFPGKVQISPSKREETQRELIQESGANIDIEEFIEGNPILIRDRKSVSGGSWKVLLIPIFGVGFALMAAIPGAIIGAITGLFNFHMIAAIVGGILFFITYPRSRRRWGSQPDTLTYFLALCGAVGGGLACYFVGNALQ